LYFYELTRIQLLAYHLLRRDTKSFKDLYDREKCTLVPLTDTENRFYEYYREQLRIPKKKQWKAVLLSTVVPGLGKLYAGKKGEAITAFIPVAANALQAYEGYYKQGTSSPHLYVFGGIGAFFYLSNIYGAKEAIKRSIDERHEDIRLSVSDELRYLCNAYY
jgi:hypothetical protein